MFLEDIDTPYQQTTSGRYKKRVKDTSSDQDRAHAPGTGTGSRDCGKGNACASEDPHPRYGELGH